MEHKIVFSMAINNHLRVNARARNYHAVTQSNVRNMGVFSVVLRAIRSRSKSCAVLIIPFSKKILLNKMIML
jgi:hypothetical protein